VRLSNGPGPGASGATRWRDQRLCFPGPYTLVRMSGDDPFDDIFDEFGRIVDDLFGGGGDDERPLVDARGASVDIHERAAEVEVVADLPGASADDVEMRCDGETLRILAADYDNRVQLPTPVDETTADVQFNNGVLSVAFERERDGATLDG
jgi:HSP20 family protein